MSGTPGAGMGTAGAPERFERPSAVLVAGPAGSGKTTLGLALARRTGAVPLDLDSVTNPLLDRLGDALPTPHWLHGPYAPRIREGRYAALRSVARDCLAGGLSVVLIAPFTAELTGGAEWHALVAALAASTTDPPTVHVLHLDGPPEVLSARRGQRGEPRDAFRPDTPPAPPPKVPHISIDVLQSREQQEFRAVQALGFRGAVDGGHPLFAGTYAAALFDLDGTLADSTPAVLRSWARLAREFGFPVDAVQRNHGRPARALLSELLPADLVETAASRVEEFETADVADISALPGALDLLAALGSGRAAVVTSGVRPVALARLAAAGIPAPAVVVTRDDVRHPKPDPEPFLLAAARLGVDPRRCVVFEDAPAGVAAGVAAGCTVVAVAGTTDPAQLAAADLVLDSLDQVQVRTGGDGVRFAVATPRPSTTP